MKSYPVRFTLEASHRISKLPSEIKRFIRAVIDDLRREPYKGSELSGDLAGYRSVNARRSRVIYRFNDEEAFLEIYFVGHRRDVYEMLRALLRASSR